MVGEIKDKKLREIWNGMADKLSDLYNHYVFENPTRQSLAKMKRGLHKEIIKYEIRLKELHNFHEIENPYNTDFNFRKVLTKYTLPKLT